MKHLLKVLLLACVPWTSAQAYVPTPAILQSPALLIDYPNWFRDLDAFRASPETRSYSELVEILYDREIEREWVNYFTEANSRLSAFRALICPTAGAVLCTEPLKLTSDGDLRTLFGALTNPASLAFFASRWGITIHPVTLPGVSLPFNIIAAKNEKTETSTASYWNYKPANIISHVLTPLEYDVNSYEANMNGEQFPAQFALTEGQAVLNDWIIRDRSMDFAQIWKRKIEANEKNTAQDPLLYSEQILLQNLYQENQDAFARTYEEYLPLVNSDAATKARFLKERAEQHYPEEIFQHVAYDLLSDLVRVESRYYVIAETERKNLSERQKALEALLTMEQYGASTRAFLLEVTTRSDLIVGHAAIIDEIADPLLALTFALEHLKVVLGMEVYGKENLFSHYQYALLTDSLFNPEYLKEYQPTLYKELVNSDGSVKNVSRMAEADQLRILREYVTANDGSGNANPSGVIRLWDVFAAQVTLADFRALAPIIHSARY